LLAAKEPFKEQFMRSVALELMRHGPDHNQLISPLTPYLGVCENAPVGSLYLPLEHDALLIKLANLRYPRGENSEKLRCYELADMGKLLGEFLAKTPGLSSAIGVQATRYASSSIVEDEQVPGREFLHLRLIVSANELSQLPFELAVGLPGFPGIGQHLALQLGMPFCLTRESRRTARSFYAAKVKPRVLFAYCRYGDSDVPAEAHLLALRHAFDPWLDPARKKQHFAELLRVLPDATLADITAACLAEEYTHVHILAHGVPLDKELNALYTIGLRKRDGSMEHVSGRNLARALSPIVPGEERLRQPMVVTLASCDSGAMQKIPISSNGDSLAHALHAAGIPMVVASQFPLSFEGSVVMVQKLYEGLLSARDPRVTLIDARHELARRVAQTHDWASLVCYLSLPPGFAKHNSRVELERLRLSVYGGQMDSIETQSGAGADGAFQKIFSRINAMFESAQSDLTIGYAHKILVCGVRRRYAHWLAAQQDGHARAIAEFNSTLVHYLAAYTMNRSHYWALTEALRIDLALSKFEPNRRTALPLQPLMCYCRVLTDAYLDLATHHSGLERAWALVNVIEVLLLADAAAQNETSTQLAINAGKIEDYAQELKACSTSNTAPIRTLKSQLTRYQSAFYRQLPGFGESDIRLIQDLLF
jgi:hypothetical protein